MRLRLTITKFGDPGSEHAQIQGPTIGAGNHRGVMRDSNPRRKNLPDVSAQRVRGTKQHHRRQRTEARSPVTYQSKKSSQQLSGHGFTANSGNPFDGPVARNRRARRRPCSARLVIK